MTLPSSFACELVNQDQDMKNNDNIFAWKSQINKIVSGNSVRIYSKGVLETMLLRLWKSQTFKTSVTNRRTCPLGLKKVQSIIQTCQTKTAVIPKRKVVCPPFFKVERCSFTHLSRPSIKCPQVAQRQERVWRPFDFASFASSSLESPAAAVAAPRVRETSKRLENRKETAKI